MIKYYYIYLLTLFALITNAQNLNVSLTKREIQCVLGRASVTATTTSQPVHYLWSTGAVSDAVEELEPGDYYVTVTANNGKDTTVYFNIESLICEPNIEGHFTPNGDGFNDTWDIGRIEFFPEFDLFVYNRWGQQVHHQSNAYIPWDGRSLSLPLPDATYYYILYLSQNDKKNFIKGAVNIVR